MKINLILLAAGNSKRFNGNKLITHIKGKPMYMHIVNKVISMDFNKIICVTKYDEIKNNLLNTNINLIANPNSKLGISTSIKLGINVDKSADAYMFMVCDQPFIRRETLEELISLFKRTNKGIVCIGNGEITGNPVIFSKKYIDELLDLEGDTGGKKVVNKHLNDLEVLQVNNKIELVDIDTKEKLAQLT